MKSIILKSLQLINFKGARNLSINFDDKSTDVFGDNGTFKTTLFDSFTWLLFGKDSTDRKDFEIKTLDADGRAIEKIDHEVNAVIEVDGDTVSIRRVLKENWVKKRGDSVTVFNGNVTEYYWNGVPVNQGEFNAKVGGILNEQVFKMITNPLAFNALKWQDRRNVLMQMAGSLSDDAIAAGNKEYENLLAQLTQGKTLEDYKKQISASIKKAKDDIKAIPARIDEVERGKPAAQDFPALKLDLDSKEEQLKSIDGQLQNNSVAFDEKLKETNTKKLRANGIKSDIATKEQDAAREADSRLVTDNTALNNFRTALTEKEAELTTATNGITTLTSKQTGIKNQIAVLDGSITAKREEWNTENAKTLSFDDAAFCCPTCKRDFEAGDVEAKKAELTTNFRNDKASKLSSIQQQGKSLADEKANLEAEVNSLTGRIESGTAIKNKLITEIELLKGNIEIEQDKTNNTAELPSREAIIESLLSADAAYQDLKTLLLEIEAKIEEVPQVDNSALLTQKDTLTKEILMLRSALRNEEQINAANIRIDQLNEEESKLAQQIADVEKIHFTIESFNKLKIDALETKINSRFQMVKFKMFDTQINGGETETCEPMINGVPFTDANTASRINAGLDIINTLCHFYEVTAPVFLDNRESVIKLIDTESQLVNLIVSEQHKTLTVGAEQLQHAFA